jgi:hypothetical protein
MATEPKQAPKADQAYLSAMGRALISTGRKHGDPEMVQRGIAKLQRLPPGTPRAIKLPPG